MGAATYDLISRPTAITPVTVGLSQLSVAELVSKLPSMWVPRVHKIYMKSELKRWELQLMILYQDHQQSHLSQLG